MVRKPCFDENGIKRGAWSQEEDDRLRAYVQKYGHCNWRELPKYAGLSRCGKSCRLRWLNYLRPDVKRGRYTEEENDLILKLHQEHGNKWSLIAEKLPGRTDNEIKNHWHTHLKKRSKPNTSTAQNEHQLSYDYLVPPQETTYTHAQPILDSSRLSPQQSLSSSSCECAASSSANRLAEDDTTTAEYYPEAIDSFWNEPFVVDTSYDQIDLNPYGYYYHDDDSNDFIS